MAGLMGNQLYLNTINLRYNDPTLENKYKTMIDDALEQLASIGDHLYIKDEKIRKAVRAWAEACGAEQVKYAIACNQYYDVRGTGFSIKFLYKPVEVWMEDGKIYTITELCGEEEE
jgi:hypothetical protein